MISSGVAVSSAGSDLEAYQEGMDIERKSYQLYKKAAEQEKDDAVRKVLLQIADEEKKHYEILQNIYCFVNAPNQFLAWGEFSNLGEFHNFGRNIDFLDNA